MAPALTSDASLNDSGKRQTLSPPTSAEETNVDPNVDLLAVLNPKDQDKEIIPSKGRKRSRTVNRTRRSRKGLKKNLKCARSHEAGSDLQCIANDSISIVNKKMNPSDDSSKSDTGYIATTSKSLKRRKGSQTKMCGSNAKPLSPNSAVCMSNGNNNLHFKDLSKQTHKLAVIPPPTDSVMISATSVEAYSEPTPSTSHSSDTLLEDKQKQMASRHVMLTRRATRLMNRARRIQARQAIAHGRQQISGFIQHQKGVLEKQMVSNREVSVDPTLNLKDAQNMSTSALVNLVQKWQAQQPVSRKHSKQEEKLVTLDDETCMELDQVSGHLTCAAHHIEKAFDSDATESSSGGESCDEADFDYDWGDKEQPPLNRRVDWRWSADRAQIASRWTWLQAQVSDLEYRIRQQTEIYKQIRQKKGDIKLGDLNGDVNSETRLQCLQQSGMSPATVAPLVTHVHEQSACLKQQLGNIYTPSPPNSASMAHIAGATATSNAQTVTPNISQSSFASHTPSSSGVSSDNSETLSPNVNKILNNLSPNAFTRDPSCVSARCRPVILGKYRKRKLLRTSSAYSYEESTEISSPTKAKQARFQTVTSSTATVRCQCYPPVTPCALCSGRLSYSATVDEQPFCPVSERVALLDHSYHQVLSLKEDVPLSIQFASLLKTGEWQQRLHSRTSQIRQFRVEKRRGQYQIKEKRKSSTKKTASLEVLSRIKNKYAAERALSALPQLSPEKKRLTSRISDIRMKKKKAALQDVLRKKERNKLLRDGESSTLRDMRDHARRRQAASAYDINNIVIPYSTLASTRLQKLQYKEILTPSWREVQANERSRRASQASCDQVKLAEIESIAETVIDVKRDDDPAPQSQPPPASTSADEALPDEEDISDAAIAARHLRCEQEEKQKFMAYTGTTPSGMLSVNSTPASAQKQRTRGRASESAASSGVMTPDPSSPDIPDTGPSGQTCVSSTPPSTPGPQLPPPAVTTCSATCPTNTESGKGFGGSRRISANDMTPVRVEVEDIGVAHRGDGTAESVTSRRRASSVSSTNQARARRRSSSAHEHQLLQAHLQGSCWPRRQFPLSDYEYSELFLDRPVASESSAKYSLRAHSRAVHVPRISTSREPLGGDFTLPTLDSPPQSPASSNCNGSSSATGSVSGGGGGTTSGSTSTGSGAIPPVTSALKGSGDGASSSDEWTVKTVAQSSLVLKIAKR